MLVSSPGLINDCSEFLLSLNLSILFWENSLMKGHSLIHGALMLRIVKFERWSERSVTRLPDEHLFWIIFLGVFMKIWSRSVAEWYVIRVGSVIQGIKLCSKKLLRYWFLFASSSIKRSMFISPSIIANVLSSILLMILFNAALKWSTSPWGCR